MKRFAHGLVVSLLSLAAVTGIALLAFSLPLTNQETVKTWADKSGVYDDITPALVNVARAEDDGLFGALLNSERVDQAAVVRMFERAYPPDLLQGQFELLVDGVYEWLKGDSAEPSVGINLGDNSAAIARELESVLMSAAASLPACRTGQVPAAGSNVLDWACLPPGVNARSAVRAVAQNVAEAVTPSEPYMWTGQDFRLSETATKTGPKVFSWAQSLPWLAGGVLLVLSALAVVTTKTPLRGFRRVGQTLFMAGLFSWIGFYLAKRGISSAETLLESEAEGQAQQQFMTTIWVPLMRSAFAGIANSGLWVALTVVLTGGIVWLAAFIWHKIHHEDKPAQPQRKSQKDQKEHILPPPVKD